jgi:hypothetical protein
MGLHDIVKIPTPISLGVIIAILAVAIIASFRVTRVSGDNKPEAVKVGE